MNKSIEEKIESKIHSNTEPKDEASERYHLVETDEYDRLVKFFVTNELEFDGDEEVDTDIVRCYKIEQESESDADANAKSNANADAKSNANADAKSNANAGSSDDGQQGLIGAAVLAKREGRYICDGIAVNPDYRGEGIGELLIRRLLGDVKELGGDGLYLVARAPGFFRTQGFQTIDPEDAPNFFECKYCPQYQKTCWPEIMKYSL